MPRHARSAAPTPRALLPHLRSAATDRALRGGMRAAAAALALLCSVGAASASAQTNPPTALTPADLHGLTFREIGPAVMSGRVVDLAVVERDPVKFYVASATGGLWKTTNNGVTWEALFTDQPVHSIGDIAVHQRDTSIVWLGTGERANRQSSSWGNGVYKSTDGGRTWTHMGLDDTHHIGRIRMHPENPDIVYVAGMGHLWGANEERGVYKTTDGGATWAKILEIDENTGVVDVALDPGSPDIVYAASYQRRRSAYGFHGGGEGSALWKSTDGGATWKKLTEGLPEPPIGRIGITVYPRDPRIVYASVETGTRYNASTAYAGEAAGLYRSDDRGETWRKVSDWNPRPMYASQPHVDPTDPDRVYMQNAFSWVQLEGDSARVVRPRQSLHGDDRILWVDPNDPRHLIKGDDGGLGISWDRAETWLYVTNLPISQFYRVSVDMRTPYWVYGGLQDNGSWAGPSATYRSEGIVNGDWIKTGGGDGFVNIPFPLPGDAPDQVQGELGNGPETELLVESQYLGLSRLDLESWQRKDLRPGDPTGHISARRNWEVWGSDRDPGPLGNAMEPANWDGPFALSPHDPNTIYAGTDELWVSRDRGDTWTSLGDLTTGTDRASLGLMGQEPDSLIPSLDDGIPYWPTLSAIALSPLDPGEVWVGTDDGLIHVSRDGGASFTEVSERLPGLPEGLLVNGIEPSRHTPGTAYVVIDGHRSDDFGNWVFRTRDHGGTWESLGEMVPPGQVARTLREDPVNPRVLYLGTEMGLYVTLDAGASWLRLGSNLPTVAVNDLVVHPRDHDLVLGTHGRGIWILDDLAPLREISDGIAAAPAHLFSIEPRAMIRYARTGGHTGDMYFRGENPPAGAMIHFWAGNDLPDDVVAITIHAPDGRLVRRLDLSSDDGRRGRAADGKAERFERGINRVVWDLREQPLSPRPRLGGGDDSGRSGPDGPWVAPGTYTVRLAVGERTWEQPVEVREDPRIETPIPARAVWAAALRDIAAVHEDVVAQMTRLVPASGDSIAGDARDTWDDVSELLSRVDGLYGEVADWVGPPTADQRARLAFYREMVGRLAPRVERAAAGGG